MITLIGLVLVFLLSTQLVSASEPAIDSALVVACYHAAPDQVKAALERGAVSK